MADLTFYFDQHVPSAIASGLRRRGIDVLTCDQDGAAQLPDEQLLERAQELGRVIFTQDADFLEIANDRMTRGHEFAGVVYAHQLHITIGQAIRDLDLTARVLTMEEVKNRVIYLPL
jgi:predicted nuclease of predicted toxin-antitoxin system